MNENENEEEKITKEITNITLEKIEPIIVKYCGGKKFRFFFIYFLFY